MQHNNYHEARKHGESTGNGSFQPGYSVHDGDAGLPACAARPGPLIGLLAVSNESASL